MTCPPDRTFYPAGSGCTDCATRLSAAIADRRDHRLRLRGQLGMALADLSARCDLTRGRLDR